MLFLPVFAYFLTGNAYGQLIITAPDTIMDGKWFTITIEVASPIIPGTDFIYLRALPAYGKDSSIADSLYLFPGWSNGTGGGVQWKDVSKTKETFQLFFKNKTAHPKDKWIKIWANLAGVAEDTSRTIFARHGPFPSTKTNDQIRIIPNPVGATGLPADITIWRKGVVDKAELKIIDSYGHLVKDLSNTIESQIKEGLLPRSRNWNDVSTEESSEYQTLHTTWDGTNGQGTRVANGVYQLCVKLIEAEEAAIWKEKIGVIW